MESCTAAAEIHLRGEAVPRDVRSAILLYGKAVKILDQGCEAQIDRDCTERDRLKLRITMPSAQPEPGLPPMVK